MQTKRLLISLGVGVVTLASLAALFQNYTKERARLQQEAKAWPTSGRPCLETSREAFVAAPELYSDHAPSASMTFDYDGVRLSRSSGRVACNEVLDPTAVLNDTYPVCKFAHPRKLAVTSDQGTHYYLTEDHPVTFFVFHGTAKCVLAD